MAPTASLEGSGQSEYDGEIDPDEAISNVTNLHYEDTVLDDGLYNETHARNGSFVHPWQDGDLVLFNLPPINQKMLYIIIGSVGASVFLLIIIIVCISCRRSKKRRENAMQRKFDTFQNPIYEKPVVPMNNAESDQEKIDLGDLSDSTVLD